MKIRTATTAQTPEALLNDLRNLVSDAELMLNENPNETSEVDFSVLLARVDAAQQSFSELYTSAKQNVTAGAKYADTAIRSNPYQSLMIALGTGLFVGILLGRRSQ